MSWFLSCFILIELKPCVLLAVICSVNMASLGLELIMRFQVWTRRRLLSERLSCRVGIVRRRFLRLQVLEDKCLCLKCPFRLRINCSHYRDVCLAFRSCSACQDNNEVMIS